MRLLWAAGLALLVIAGCGARPNAAEAQPTESQPPELLSPAARLQDQLQSGAFQASVCLESLEAAREALLQLGRELKDPALRQGVAEATALLDSCGTAMAELAAEAPTVQDVEADFAKYDERRLAAIEMASDALVELKEALGIAESLIEQAPQGSLADAEALRVRLAAAIDDVMGVVEGFGGRVPDSL